MAERRLSKRENIPWKGVLSLLVKKKKKYTFLQLYWHLVPKEKGTIWMMGYKAHMVGSELMQEFQINAFTRDLKLPEVASPLCSGGEHPICLQTPDDVIFFSADSEQKREEVFQILSSHFNLPAQPEKRAVRVEPAPEVSSSKHDQYGRHYDVTPQAMGPYYNLTYPPRPRGTDVNDPYGYEKIEDGVKNVRNDTQDDAMSYEVICSPEPKQERPPAEPKQERPPVPPRNYKNWPIYGDTDNISEASTVDVVANLRDLEPEANIGGTDSPHYRSATAEETSFKRASLSLLEFVQKFRRQKFKGPLITKHKREINWKAVKFCFVEDKMITVAGLSPDMYTELHVGDVITKVNSNSLSSVSQFYDLIESSDTDKIELEILRVPNGCLCHVTLPANGRTDFLGLFFSDRKKCGVEVTEIKEDGKVFKSHDVQKLRPEGVIDPTQRVNWGLVEINQQPVPLHSSKEQVDQLLRNAGIELALIFLPMDLVHVLRDSCPEK